MAIMDGALTSIAFCWRVERADGAGLGLTSSDRDLTLDGVTYLAAPGVTPAAISRSVGLMADSGEISGALSAEALTETDLALGRWDAARMTLSAVDWFDPAGEVLPLLAGELGEVTTEGEQFSVELRGAAARLQEAPCPSTSPECRARLGDKSCGVDLAGRMVRAVVVSASGNVLELDRAIGSEFLFGRLRYLAGENCGLSSTILSIDGASVALRDRPRGRVETGATVTLREGCDKRFETCASRFSNAANFRGEPHLPGTDLLTRYPGA